MSRVVAVFSKNIKDINKRRNTARGDAILSGTLHKQGAVNTGWKRRYFCIFKEECSVYYYATEGDAEPRGVIPLGGMEVKRCSEKTREQNPYTFKLYNPKTVKYSRIKQKFVSGHRAYYMYANTAEEETTWINAIQEGIDSADRESMAEKELDEKGYFPSFCPDLTSSDEEDDPKETSGTESLTSLDSSSKVEVRAKSGDAELKMVDEQATGSGVSGAKERRLSLQNYYHREYLSIKESSKEKYDRVVKSIKTTHARLAERDQKIQTGWKKSTKASIKQRLEQLQSKAKTLEAALAECAIQEEKEEGGAADASDASGSAKATEFSEIETHLSEVTEEIGNLKLELYCPKEMGYVYRFQGPGVFVGMEDFDFGELGLDFGISVESATPTSPASVSVQLSPLTIAFNAFRFKIVIENEKGQKQLEKSLEKFAINIQMVSETRLYYTTATDYEHNGLGSKKKGKDKTDEWKWYTNKFDFEITHSLRKDGSKQGIMHGIIVGLVNKFLPSLVKDTISSSLAEPIGVYLKNTAQQSFYLHGKVDLAGAATLDVVNAPFKRADSKPGSSAPMAETKKGPVHDALEMLGGIESSSVFSFRKLRKAIGPYGSERWNKKWKSLGSLQRYIQYMKRMMTEHPDEEWEQFLGDWETLGTVATDHCNTPLNMRNIFTRVEQMTRKPLHLHLQLMNLRCSFDLNLLTTMQRNLAEWYIHEAMPSAPVTAQDRLTMRRGLVDLKKLQHLDAQRIQALEVLASSLKTSAATVSLSLDGGIDGILKLFFQELSLTIPHQLQITLGKIPLSPSVDSMVYRPVNPHRNSSGAGPNNDYPRYILEYCSPLTKKHLSAPNVGGAAEPAEKENAFLKGAPLEESMMLQESQDYPGHNRVSVFSWQNFDMLVRINRKKLLERLMQDDENAPSDLTLSNLHFAVDQKQPDTFLLDALSLEDSLADIKLQKLKVVLIPTRILQYLKEYPINEEKLSKFGVNTATRGTSRNSEFSIDVRPKLEYILKAEEEGLLKETSAEKPDSVASASPAEETVNYDKLLGAVRHYASSTELSVHFNSKFSLFEDDADGHMHMHIDEDEGSLPLDLKLSIDIRKLLDLLGL